MKNYTKEQKEQINYAFNLLCDEENFLRPILCKPFQVGCYAVATNGKVLAMVSRGALPLKFTRAKNKIGRCPNAMAVIHSHVMNKMITVEAMGLALEGLKEKSVVKIDYYYAATELRKVYDFCKILGIEMLAVGYDKYKKIYFEAQVENTDQRIMMLLMPLENVKQHDAEIYTLYSLNPDVETHIEAATEYHKRTIAEIAAEEARKEEERNKKNFTCYEVTFTKQVTVLVKAFDEDEAKEYADKICCCELDWEDDCGWEIESLDETCREWSEDDYDHYYDEDGDKCKWEE